MEDKHVSIPGPNSAVWKNECVKCFHNARHPGGVNVCLKCFTANCDPHAKEHAVAFGHAVAVNVREIAERPPKDSAGTDQSPPQKLTKLAIGVEGGAEGALATKWRMETSIRQWPSGDALQATDRMSASVAALMSATDTGLAEEAKSWEKRIHPCEHTLTLHQDPGATQAAEATHCSACDLKKPLWMCLTCGNFGCGRPLPPPLTEQGGRGHALEHRRAFPDHVLVAKMGTITPDGKGDVYCYGCDDEVIDEDLGAHLAHFGMQVASQRKTEMTMTEMELERNKMLDLLSTEDGAALERAHGPGFTGLRNIGNTCYMNSVLQSLIAIPELRELFHDRSYRNHLQNCRVAEPARCWQCQMGKLAHGLLSGDYSRPADSEVDEVGGGVAPRMWKQLVTRGSLFEGVDQQDASEFLQFLLKKMTENQRRAGEPDPAPLFSFDLSQRLQCLKCKGVRYATEKGTSELSLSIPREAANPPLAAAPKDEGPQDRMKRQYASTVPFDACLKDFSSAAYIDGFHCPRCKAPTTAATTRSLASFPQVLLAQMRRFTTDEGWVPLKLSMKIGGLDNINGHPVVVDLSSLAAPAQRDPSEQELGEAAEPSAAAPVVDMAIVGALEQMGFPRMACERAAFETKGAGVEAASEWLFGHMEDPLLEQPIPRAGGAGGGKKVAALDPVLVVQITSMGIDEQLARYALGQCDANVERAIDWVFSHPDFVIPGEHSAPAAESKTEVVVDDGRPKRYQLFAFVVHKGNTIQMGHYVAYVWSEQHKHWVLFDDERVFISEKPPIDQAYFYLFRRVQ